MLLEYTNCVNVAGQIDDDSVDVQVLKTAQPKYIFYSDANALKAIKTDSVMSKLPAIKAGNVLQITDSEMKRQGGTAVQTVKRMVDFVYKGKASTPEQPVTSANQKATEAQQATKAENQQATHPATKAAATQQATQPTTKAAANQQATQPTTTAQNAAANTSVAAQYKINLTGLSLKKEQKNGNVKIMQKRLYDLGYIDDAENVTGYYGEVSEKAVKDFQQANGISATGTADNATLVKLFEKTAKKAG